MGGTAQSINGKKDSIVNSNKQIYHQFNAKITTYSREEHIELINFLGEAKFDILLNPKDFEDNVKATLDDSTVME